MLIFPNLAERGAPVVVDIGGVKTGRELLQTKLLRYLLRFYLNFEFKFWVPQFWRRGATADLVHLLHLRSLHPINDINNNNNNNNMVVGISVVGQSISELLQAVLQRRKVFVGWCILRNADCGMRNFDHVYFAEILMRNVPQIIRCSNSAIRIPQNTVS